MTTFRIDLAYHGGDFCGWARQPGLRTVEGELGSALEKMLGEEVVLRVAGRTDAGVHALAQVASFSSERASRVDLRRALNAMTGSDVAVAAVTAAADDFDAREDARSRTYCYRVLAAAPANPFERGLSLWWPYPVELEALDRCAAALAGEHDFTAFTPSQGAHRHFRRRILRSEWQRGEAGIVEFWIEAESFMHNMVRALVGTMLAVGKGKLSPDDFSRLLEGAPRAQGGDTAHPHGLYLAGVAY